LKPIESAVGAANMDRRSVNVRLRPFIHATVMRRPGPSAIG
jgi:hypothetical protein